MLGSMLDKGSRSYAAPAPAYRVAGFGQGRLRLLAEADGTMYASRASSSADSYRGHRRMVIHVIVASDPIQGGCEALREDHKGIGQALWRGPHGGAAVSHVVIQQLLLDPQQGSP
jgi:hypothetical protein